MTMDRFDCTITPEEVGGRLDSFVTANCGLSRTLAQQLIADGNVLVNGKKVQKGYKVAAGEVVSITVPPPKDTHLVAQDIPLEIVYEDQWLVVVNKPKGMVVHPAAGNPDGTLVNALLHHCAGSLSGIGGELRPGIVHRIDKDTSGLLVVAKDDETHRALADQFAQHSSEREYDAMVYGRFRQPEGEIDAPIGRSRNDRKKMAVVQTNSKQAITTYRVIAEYNGFSHLKLRLKTGRTHQIRVHMAEMGHPLAGDAVYGPKKVIKRLHGQCLHAGLLGFIHPQKTEQMTFTCPLPEYFTSFEKSLGPPVNLEEI